MGNQDATNASNKVDLRVAVILRTHLLNEKFYDLLDILSRSERYDLFVAADETSGSIDVSNYNKLSHTVDSAGIFGLCQNHPNILWHCGDYALYFSAAQIPNYHYYIMIEYDVDFVRRSPEFVERLIEKLSERDMPDFVAAAFHEASPDWCWTEAAAKQFPVVYYTSIYAFVAVSGRALNHLLERRRREARDCASAQDIVMCEAFCGSALAEGGYVCVSLNELIDGAVNFSTFHPPVPILSPSQYLLNQYTVSDPKIEMIHPVYDLRNYLKKQFEKFRDLHQLHQFMRELEQINTTRTWEADLISEYRERCSELEHI
jgi:hypothetical protein